MVHAKKRQPEFISGTTGWRLNISLSGEFVVVVYQAVSGSRLLRSSVSAS